MFSKLKTIVLDDLIMVSTTYQKEREVQFVIATLRSESLKLHT